MKSDPILLAAFELWKRIPSAMRELILKAHLIFNSHLIFNADLNFKAIFREFGRSGWRKARKLQRCSLRVPPELPLLLKSPEFQSL